MQDILLETVPVYANFIPASSIISKYIEQKTFIIDCQSQHSAEKWQTVALASLFEVILTAI